MYKTLLQSIRQWNATYSERSKLQHSYIAFAIIAIIMAGLVGLVDYDLSQRLTGIALLLLGVFFVNLIAWTLLSGLLLTGLESPKRSTTRSTSKTSTKR